MKQKVSIFILIALFLSIVLVFGECRGPIVPGSPAITDTPYATLGIGQLTIYPPSTGANGTVGAPSTEEPYRVPAYPSISETGIPYPQPPTQVEGPIETTLPTGYATPSATNTQLVTETPSASQTPVINSPTPTATDTIIPASPSFTPSPTLNPGLISYFSCLSWSSNINIKGLTNSIQLNDSHCNTDWNPAPKPDSDLGHWNT
jgi:hypothetical protein